MHEKFGLHSAPFRLTPDPAMFFGSRGHVRAQSYLTFGLSQGEGFVVITGDVGAGKTTLISHLLANLQDQKYRIARIVTSDLNSEDTLRMIVINFGLEEAIAGDGKATLLRQLENILADAARKRERCLLIIDEVQNMPFATLEELRMLSNIDVPSGTSIQTILVGQPEFRQIIARPELRQLRQRVVASCHLSPIEENEVREYMLFRMQQAGWTGDPSFGDDIFSEVYHSTQGVPRRINLLCSRLILQAALDDSHHISRDDVIAVAEELEAETVSTDASIPAEDTSIALLKKQMVSNEIATLITDMQQQISSLERRINRHDRAFKRALLGLSEYLREIELGP